MRDSLHILHGFSYYNHTLNCNIIFTVPYIIVIGSNRSRGHTDADSKELSSGISYWETLVLFTVNFTKLNVHMNMGNVMGNV